MCKDSEWLLFSSAHDPPTFPLDQYSFPSEESPTPPHSMSMYSTRDNFLITGSCPLAGNGHLT